jgi:hypothetical protein
MTVKYLTELSGAIYSNSTCFGGSVPKLKGIKEEYVNNIDWVICFSNLLLGDNIKMIFAIRGF